MSASKTYLKPALASSDLVSHWQAKGLIVSDIAAATETLDRIGYYRLLIYTRPLQDNSKKFLSGTKFEDVLALYEFDRELRLLCLDAIERIEVALRSSLVNNLAVPFGPHFYLEHRHYETKTGRKGFVAKARKAEYLALTHYRNNYRSPKDAPIWAILEAVTFGVISTLFADLSVANRRAVARPFGYDESVLVSWFRTLNILRNMCAHHNRLWNFKYRVNQPKTAKALREVFHGSDTFHARAVVLVALLNRVDPTSQWKSRLVTLITNTGARVSPDMLGFPPGWESNPFWL